MDINFNEMSKNKIRKVCRLLEKASDFEWNFKYSEIGVNQNGNVYIYSEDEPYTLFIDLEDDLMACKTDYDTGEEDIIEVGEMSWFELEKWGDKPIV